MSNFLTAELVSLSRLQGQGVLPSFFVDQVHAITACQM